MKSQIKRKDWLRAPEQSTEEVSIDPVDVDRTAIAASYYEPKSEIKKQVKEMKKSKLF